MSEEWDASNPEFRALFILEDGASVARIWGVKGCTIIAIIYDLGVTKGEVRRTRKIVRRTCEWLLHEECGVRAGTGTDFDRRKNRALKELVDHVGNKKGYYATRTFYYPQFNVLGQCEGDLGVDDCVNCVKPAIDFAQADCGSAFNGDVYLQKCYISYSDGGDNNGGNTGGLVALVVAAVLAMSNLLKFEFLALDTSGQNYLSWVLDAEIYLAANGLGDTIQAGKETTVEQKAKAMIFLRHHLHENLKIEYLTVKDPLSGNTSGPKKWQDKGKMIKNDGGEKEKGAIEHGCYRCDEKIDNFDIDSFGIGSLDVDPKDQNDTTHLDVSDFLTNE
ncbi:Gnk2-like domain-containing protein [Tanacetum coccineum]